MWLSVDVHWYQFILFFFHYREWSFYVVQTKHFHSSGHMLLWTFRFVKMLKNFFLVKFIDFVCFIEVFFLYFWLFFYFSRLFIDLILSKLASLFGAGGKIKSFQFDNIISVTLSPKSSLRQMFFIIYLTRFEKTKYKILFKKFLKKTNVSVPL